MYKSKFYTISGIAILSFLFYRTILLTRVPYKINEHVGFYMRVVIVLVLVMQIVIFYKTLKEIIKPTNVVMLWLAKIIETLYYKPLSCVRDIMLKKNLFKKYILKCAGALWYTVKESYHVYLVVFTILIMPKIIAGTTLILDVILLNEMKVFYEIM